ncbi:MULTISPECIES: hypothetical protein [Bacillus]|uniref:DUF1433 domain-containing protein n=1 Tax=Bacillus glycinifermentans TaxID=1664069 RepID=A0AAJ4D1C6_9BACI|nr:MULTISPECIES: hypothetical protein [Bacillus]KKB73562.1 hypothetical protein TH62_11580 [Bacillus sp. TH008]MBU8786730.1 hypothetical protein [Bacillus glycinifermentans]MDU0072419.1 hypothetical protein [Bacillus sp. IG6]MED8020212.1 hypothetical protein [Bacillus glycinifermentans]NUJ18275.1 hypothetical protein [Bacillus glycinifermentans]
MKKKIVYSVLLFITVAFVLAAYNSFNGNPVSGMLSKKALERYLAERYPDKELEIEEGVYNFKFAEYVFDVTEVGDQTRTYQFTLTGFFKPEVNIDGIHDANLDEQLMKRLGGEASKELKAVLERKVRHLVDADVYLEVLKDKLADNAKWSKDIKLDGPMQIELVLDAADSNQEDIYRAAKTVQHVLKDQGYDYEYVNINANDFAGEDTKDMESGYVKYAVSFEKGADIKLSDVETLNQ